MFNSLKGTLTGTSPSKIFLEIQGVEFEIEASFQTLSSLPPLGSTVRLFIYLHHREDTLKLFGFLEEEERKLFLHLLKVEGIGPKQALRILSGTTVQAFWQIVSTGDAKSLTRIPGLGIKTAQKVLFSLQGKLKEEESPLPAEERDLQVALVEMGFEPSKARIAIQKALKEGKELGLAGETLEREAFRRAIILMSNS
ncbi:MAG: Holliday junction branch migration protein RuvA [Spirochaetales bacterium]